MLPLPIPSVLNTEFIGWAILVRRPQLPSLTPEFRQFECTEEKESQQLALVSSGKPGASFLVSIETRGQGRALPQLSSLFWGRAGVVVGCLSVGGLRHLQIPHNDLGGHI